MRAREVLGTALVGAVTAMQAAGCSESWVHGQRIIFLQKQLKLM